MYSVNSKAWVLTCDDIKTDFYPSPNGLTVSVDNEAVMSFITNSTFCSSSEGQILSSNLKIVIDNDASFNNVKYIWVAGVLSLGRLRFQANYIGDDSSSNQVFRPFTFEVY